MDRRNFIAGVIAAALAPAVPVAPVVVEQFDWVNGWVKLPHPIYMFRGQRGYVTRIGFRYGKRMGTPPMYRIVLEPVK